MNEKLDERAKAQPKLENQCAAMHTSGNLCNTTPHPLFIERVDRRADYIHRSRTWTYRYVGSSGLGQPIQRLSSLLHWNFAASDAMWATVSNGPLW